MPRVGLWLGEAMLVVDLEFAPRSRAPSGPVAYGYHDVGFNSHRKTRGA